MTAAFTIRFPHLSILYKNLVPRMSIPPRNILTSVLVQFHYSTLLGSWEGRMVDGFTFVAVL